IMPLIPKDLQILQMLADGELKNTCWGIERNCNGIFLPEMAFSQSILPNLKARGYSWTIIDDEVFRIQYGGAPFNRVAAIRGFKIFLRSNYWSNRISGGKFSFEEIRGKMNHEIPDWTKNQPAYLIIAMDAETFGHHHLHLIKNFLEPMVKEWGSEGENILAPIEEIGRIFPDESLIKIQDCSWATTEDDYWKDDPYPLWNSKFNPHHRNLWQLVNMALRHFGNPEANLDCLKITSSCQWWWISGRPRWEPGFMKFGARKALEIIERHGSPKEISEAKKIFERLIISK
ncbi:MAG: hypothetical protein Q8L57_03750, partial [bacterium]|nr:hypothetical protein [bacterium]